MASFLGKVFNRTGGDSSPVPYVASGPTFRPNHGLGAPSETTMRTYGTSGTIFAIVSLLAQSTAGPEWKLFRKAPRDGRVRYTTGDRGTDQRIEIVQHAALNVWTKPNNFYTRHEFMEASQQHLDLTGETFWVVARDARVTMPLALWPVRPDRLSPVPDPETFIKGWIYTSPDGQKVPLELSDVIQIKYPNPLDPYRGLGPVQAVLTDIDAMRYGAEWNRNFFINSATPGGVIQVDKRLTDDEWNELTNRWRESHQGVSRAHRVAVLENGATWQERSYSMRDMQFSELRNVSRDVIREAFRMHKSMLGVADDVNRANAQTAEEVFVQWHVINRLDRFRMALNERFLPMFYPEGADVPVEFDYVNPSTTNREADNAELQAKAAAAKTLVDAGFDRDDVCEVVGLPPMRVAALAIAPASDAPTGSAASADSADEPPDDNAQDVTNEAAVRMLRDLWNDDDRSWLGSVEAGTDG